MLEMLWSQNYCPLHRACVSSGLFRSVAKLKVQYVAIRRGKECCAFRKTSLRTAQY